MECPQKKQFHAEKMEDGRARPKMTLGTPYMHAPRPYTKHNTSQMVAEHSIQGRPREKQEIECLHGIKLYYLIM